MAGVSGKCERTRREMVKMNFQRIVLIVAVLAFPCTANAFVFGSKGSCGSQGGWSSDSCGSHGSWGHGSFGSHGSNGGHGGFGSGGSFGGCFRRLFHGSCGSHGGCASDCGCQSCGCDNHDSGCGCEGNHDGCGCGGEMKDGGEAKSESHAEPEKAEDKPMPAPEKK
jgi:hypothetical protein